MSVLEGVHMKIPLGSLLEDKEDVESVTAPEITIPDYLNILQDTEYEFSLEHWVLTGLQGGYPCQPRLPKPCSSSDVPSCPPYWLMFSSPQQSRLASRHSSDFWEPNPRQRSHSLNPAVLRAKVSFAISDSEDEGEDHPLPFRASFESSTKPSLCQRVLKKSPKAFTPDLLNPPACLSSLPHQRRKNLRQCSLSILETSFQGNQKLTSQCEMSCPFRRLTDDRVSTSKTTHSDLTPGADSTVELLSALNPEERELLQAITDRGYPLRTAIIALQKAGQQTPEQILSYLVACEHLCELGYDEPQVEEALEMFQNCEKKAEEFLHLLSQFNEMGFQQNTIKEVLLVHENHREKALEELMIRIT